MVSRRQSSVWLRPRLKQSRGRERSVWLPMRTALASSTPLANGIMLPGEVRLVADASCVSSTAPQTVTRPGEVGLVAAANFHLFSSRRRVNRKKTSQSFVSIIAVRLGRRQSSVWLPVPGASSRERRIKGRDCISCMAFMSRL